MDRAEALDWASQARRSRDELVESLRSGALDLDGALERARSDDLVGRIHLVRAVEALPGWGKVASRRALADLGVDETTCLVDVDRAPLVARFEVAPVILVISGPGGVGKGTLVERLLERDDRLWLSRSWTTRARRPGEAADAYHFATRDEFLEHVERGGFLEWIEFLDYLQGSPLPEAPSGSDVVFEIDVNGARSVLERFPEAVSVFVVAPSREEQAARLRARGDSPDRVLQRLSKSDEEAASAAELGSIVVVNDRLDEAVAELEAIIGRTRAEEARSDPSC